MFENYNILVIGKMRPSTIKISPAANIAIYGHARLIAGCYLYIFGVKQVADDSRSRTCCRRSPRPANFRSFSKPNPSPPMLGERVLMMLPPPKHIDQRLMKTWR
jgi:hypothetical protein